MLAGSGISVGSTTAAGVDIRSAGQGSALLDAGAGAVTFDGTASLDMGGNVQLRAGTAITLAGLKGASVSLSAAGGAISPAANYVGPAWLITADALKLDATGAIGTPTSPFVLDVGKLSARTGVPVMRVCSCASGTTL